MANKTSIFLEQYVEDQENFSDLILQEAADIFLEDHVGWETIQKDGVRGPKIERAFLDEPFNGLYITRSEKLVDCQPGELFKMLTSKEAMGILNGGAQKTKTVTKVKTRSKDLEVTLSEKKMGFLHADREFLTFKTTDPKTWRMASKSILHQQFNEGHGSKYSPAPLETPLCVVCAPESNKCERGFQTIALEVKSEISMSQHDHHLGIGGRSVAKVLCFRDLCGYYSPSKINSENVQLHNSIFNYVEESLDEAEAY